MNITKFIKVCNLMISRNNISISRDNDNKNHIMANIKKILDN